MSVGSQPMTATPAREPIVAIASAPGRGAVGIVRVSGHALHGLIGALCARPLAPRRASYQPFLDADGGPIDHGLALYFPAPHSYTGEDVLELQAHGGPVVLRLLLERCLSAAAETDPASGRPRLPGLRLARPGEFTERAFLNDKLDLAQAEAVADLIDASTAAAARSASRSLAGAFSRQIEALLDALTHLRMLLEATIDFPEEEIDVLSAQDVAGQLARLQAAVAGVRQQAHQGALLREGLHVVIAGQPNVGKSSLLNALAGAELAIVTDIAGTTRDVLRQTIQIEGVPLHIIDTAGLRGLGAADPAGAGGEPDRVERIGIERAWGEIGRADVLLFLHDLTRLAEPDYQRADQAIAAHLRAQGWHRLPRLQVYNKADAAAGVAVPEDGLVLSARTGAGLDTLRQRLLATAGWQPQGEGSFIARERHVQALARVAAHLDGAATHLGPPPMLELMAEEMRLAQRALGEITGEFSADELLGVIFSRFCIGK